MRAMAVVDYDKPLELVDLTRTRAKAWLCYFKN